MSYVYELYGLNLSVPFPCTMLNQAPPGSQPDVIVSEGSVPRSLESPAMSDQSWQAAPGLFLFRGGRRAGRFLVEKGTTITLERNPAAEDRLLCTMLITSVIAALFRQRGMLVLHANVVVTPRGAIAICGESGSGKSTTQAVLMKHGCLMLTDDVTVLCQRPDGTIIALPGVPKMNLCEDAAIRLGHDISLLPRNPLTGGKVIVPVTKTASVSHAVPLKALYLITKHSGEKLIASSLNGVEKFAALQDCVYGPQLPEEMPGLFPLVKAVVEQIDIVKLQRPSHGCSIDKVMTAILHG